MTVLVFQAAGFTVLAAANTGQALGHLRTTRVDALMTDFELPGGSGTSLIYQAINEGRCWCSASS